MKYFQARCFNTRAADKYGEAVFKELAKIKEFFQEGGVKALLKGMAGVAQTV